jgi:hypothetical protein
LSGALIDPNINNKTFLVAVFIGVSISVTPTSTASDGVSVQSAQPSLAIPVYDIWIQFKGTCTKD